MNIRKFTGITVAAGAALFALTGCGGGIAGTPQVDWSDRPATAPAVAPEPPAHTATEQIYLDVLDEGGIYYATDQAAIDGGRAVCKYLDTAVPLVGSDLASLDVVGMAMDAGFSAYDAGYIVGAATASFCPEHASAQGI